jgi:PIN domain nuclease of toxin-antitoxin system
LRQLLDTHLVLWWMEGEVSKISERALAALGSEGLDPVVSAVTVWEVAIKRSLGKVKARAGMLDEIERAGVELLPVTARHADLVASLPLHHRDPFDRLLVAQATAENIPLVTNDESLRRYDVEVIW